MSTAATALSIALVLEDERDHALIRDLLHGVQGYEIALEGVRTYEAAVEMVDRDEHDIYVFDHALEGRSGLELLREVTANECRRPIIFLVAEHERESGLEAVRVGAADYILREDLSVRFLERSLRYALERKRLEEEVLRVAYYDSLTGLPNRLLFRDRLSQALAGAGRRDTLAAVFFLDLDNFKTINDTLGHRVGDLALKRVGERLTALVRKSDTVGRHNLDKINFTFARLGGDEFTILLTELRRAGDARIVAKRVLEALSTPFILEGHEVTIGASVGIAIHPDDGSDVDTLLKHADEAMYGAKATGKSAFRFYGESANTTAQATLTLEKDLHGALKREEFVLHYLPEIDPTTDAATGMEALIRWQHLERGTIGPGEFLPVAEDSGLILPLDAWVLHAACRQARSWQDAGVPATDVSVNVSARLFACTDFIPSVARALDRSGLDPASLVVEISADILSRDVPGRAAALHGIAEMGVRVCIDDFGTACIGLKDLASLPVSSLKIDRAYVAGLVGDPQAVAVFRAIVAVGHSLGLRVVAEGVETAEQKELVRELGCDRIQGYWVSPPVPPEEAAGLLAARAAGHP